jgi:site-specific recombinase XerD
MTPLRQRMLEDMGIRNLAENTQLCYLQQVSRYARHFDRSPEELGPEQIRTYQVHLTKTCKLAPSTISIATAALRFLYKVTLKRDWAPDDIPMPKKPFNLPVVLSPEEVAHFLACVDSLKQRTILTTAYATGLRVSEATHLKVTDVDSQRMVVRVDQGKGCRDRYVMLSPRLLEVLREYWKVVRQDLAVSGRHPRPAHHALCRRAGLPEGASCSRNCQADHTALLAPRVCHPLAGSWQ